MDHSGHGSPSGQQMAIPKMGSGKAGYGSDLALSHAPNEYGPQVDMRAEKPQYRLDDPGVGLRDVAAQGRKVLTYADLRNR